MSIRNISCCFFASLFIIACGTASNKEKEETRNDSAEHSNNNTGLGNEAGKEQLNSLITESKKTMDSIDIAYNYIRRLSPMLNLSADDRQQVNEALMELNSAKELIILETQQAVIQQLNQKTASLNVITKEMNVKSEKLQNIATTLTRICGLIKKPQTYWLQL